MNINEVAADDLEFIYKTEVTLVDTNLYESRLVEAAMIQWKETKYRDPCNRCVKRKEKIPEYRTLHDWQDGACGCYIKKGRTKEYSRSKT